MARYANARWRGPVPNRRKGGMVRPVLGLVLHIECGTEAGTDSWFHNPKAQASAHFGNPKTGPLDQWVNTDDAAWAEAAGNDRWISVEHEGRSGDALTHSQIENDAQLLAWLHLTERVPLQVTNRVGRPGLGWHGMVGQAWGGHLDCPGEAIKKQRAQIITRAKEITAGHNGNQPHPGRPYSKMHAALIRHVTAVMHKRAKGAPLDVNGHALTADLIRAARTVQAHK